MGAHAKLRFFSQTAQAFPQYVPVLFRLRSALVYIGTWGNLMTNCQHNWDILSIADDGEAVELFCILCGAIQRPPAEREAAPGFIGDTNGPLISLQEMSVIFARLEDAARATRTISETCVEKFGAPKTEEAFYCGAEWAIHEMHMLIEEGLGMRPPGPDDRFEAA